MPTLFHAPLSAPSRFVRLILEEYAVSAQLIIEDEWRQRPEFRKLNLAGTVPVFLEGELESKAAPICGADIICEYLDETRGALQTSTHFFPANPLDRAEVRRLCHWFLNKFANDTIRPIVHERIIKQNIPANQGGGAPNSKILRQARANITPHLQYLSWAVESRHYLANPNLTYADFAAAASISILDYIGEIDWNDCTSLYDWYARLKSRPSFRPLLTDRLREMAPVSHYADLDF